MLLTALSCGQSSLFSLAGTLDGTWEWQFNDNPSGSGMGFSLTAAGTNIVGSGAICGVGPACAPGAVAITGQASGISFRLTIKGDNGYVATYSGNLIGSDELSGTWTQGTASNTVIFYRK
jgi:hypothetical protein